MPPMSTALPSWPDLGVAAALAGVAAALLGIGRLSAGRAMPPETALIAGWGMGCLLLTACGVMSVPLSLACAAFAAAALPGLRQRPRIRQPLLLSLPLWFVLLPALPSQIDTWLNLLPNLAYLADHGALPRDGGPPSWSFLPAAPYNTQFVGFAVSLLTGSLAANVLSLFNVLLLCAAGLHLGRVVAGPSLLQSTVAPAWWACAAGLLLAVPLNPGFTPRVFFASYGEAPLAVTLMIAVALGADLFAAAQARAPTARLVTTLALVLAAMVEIKQSALGLLLPFSACLLILGLAAPAVHRARWCGALALANAPALLLYLLWRWYVLRHFAAGELKMLPVAELHLDLLPAILRGIAFAIFQKATYFVAVACVLAAAVIEARARPWQRAAIVTGLGAGLVTGFNGFLLFTYVAHFPAIWAVNAHSYFRYMSQLSLVMMLGLATWLRPAVAAWLARRPHKLRQRTAAAAVAATLLLPILAARLLRFDLDPPQPLLWSIGHRAASLLHDRDRVALVMPGDGDDAVGSLLRGVLLFSAPRHPHLDFRSEPAANPAALEDARAAGFFRALVTCSQADLGGLPAGTSGLLAYDAGTWHPLAVWPLPADLRRVRFSAMLPHSPFCA